MHGTGDHQGNRNRQEYYGRGFGILWYPPMLGRLETVSGCRGNLSMWALCDAKPVVALTELS